MEKSVGRNVAAAVKIVCGSLIFAAGFRFFAYPNDIVSGGVTGIAMIINYLSGLPVGVLSIIINIPLFAVSWKKFGLRFIVSSFISMTLCSVFIDLLTMVDAVGTHDLLLAAVYGGVVQGLGLGIVFSASATTGGVDIVAKLLRARYPYMNLGSLLLALDVAVIGTFAVVFRKFDSAMYSIIGMFISSRVIDFVLYGAVNSKVCYIITDENERMKKAIVESLDRGVTLLRGEGGFSGEKKEVILCVIKRREIVELRRMVQSIDEGAFMFVCDSREVFGEGFSYIGDDI